MFVCVWLCVVMRSCGRVWSCVKTSEYGIDGLLLVNKRKLFQAPPSLQLASLKLNDVGHVTERVCGSTR